MATKGGASERSLRLCDELWTAEATRLLLEVDEGWVGFHGHAAWSWRDETYDVFAAVCRERQWPCNSQAACVAMLQALRTGAVRMHLSSATRTSDGCAQWTLDEMRELGAQMKRVADGKSPSIHWTAQFVAFMEAMKTKDPTYRIAGRMVDDFVARAEKYVPEATSRNGSSTTSKTVATTRKTRSPTRAPEERPRTVTKGQKATEEAEAGHVDSDDKPLVPKRRRARAQAARRNMKRRRRRVRSQESDGDTSYHDPTSDEEVEYREDDSALRIEEDNSVPATQELTSQGELLPPRPAAEVQRALPKTNSVNLKRPYLPENVADEEKTCNGATTKRVAPRQDANQDEQVQGESSRQNMIRASPNGSQNGSIPSRKSQRVQQPASDGRNSSNSQPDAPPFRSLNPYDRQGKPWGEFVVEVLLAERTARNEDELDYVQFVRGLYEF